MVALSLKFPSLGPCLFKLPCLPPWSGHCSGNACWCCREGDHCLLQPVQPRKQCHLCIYLPCVQPGMRTQFQDLLVNLCPCGIAPAARSSRSVGVLGVPPSLPCLTSLLTGDSLGCVAPWLSSSAPVCHFLHCSPGRISFSGIFPIASPCQWVPPGSRAWHTNTHSHQKNLRVCQFECKSFLWHGVVPKHLLDKCSLLVPLWRVNLYILNWPKCFS